MKEHPILFSGPMVRAILEGRKTQTRRVVKPQFGQLWGCGIRHGETVISANVDIMTKYGTWKWINCPYGQPGDLLWVRETWCFRNGHMIASKECIQYKAEGFDPIYDSRWHPSIHMPRWASRLTLRITDIRVHRIQEIKDDDCIAEGVVGAYGLGPWDAFQEIWDSINGKRAPWESNPWVWAITFEKT